MTKSNPKKLLGSYRGSESVDINDLVNSLVGVDTLGARFEFIFETDINPLIISMGKSVVVDGLVVLKDQ